MGAGREDSLLRKMGLDVNMLDDGCCGLAGSFGFEPAKYELSMKVGEAGVLPKVRAAAHDTLIVADGFSCKTQIEQSTDRHALHIAQILQMAATEGRQGTPGEYPERRWLSLKRNDGYIREMVTAGAALALGGLWYWASRVPEAPRRRR